MRTFFPPISSAAGSEIATLARRLGETMVTLKESAEAMAEVYALAATVIEVMGDIEHAESHVAKMRELDAVAVYGQALAAARTATIEAGQRYAGIALQVQPARREQADLQARVRALQKGAAVPAALLQRFYGLYLDAKSGLFAAAQGYRDSYRYWALSPSSVNPSIVDGVDGLDTGLKNLTGIALDFNAALEHFEPPPQSLVDKQFVVDDPESLARLAAEGELHWVLPLSAPAFAGLDRVRLSRVRIWLDGATVPDGGTVNVQMATQGNDLDRLADKTYRFTSNPLVRKFQYRVERDQPTGTAPNRRFPNGTFGYVEVDGVVDDEVRYAYFQPTPFAEWRVRVTGDGLDLSGVTRLVMQFAGSVIPRP